MIFTETSIKGAYLITPSLFEDQRGWFMRAYCSDEFKAAGFTEEWLQINHSCTAEVGSVRGMHFQNQPHAEIKTVRCIAGEIFDVIVDIRRDSPTFLKWTGVNLSARNKQSLYIPKGVAHGFQVLQPDSQLIYLHSSRYNKDAEGGLLHNDPLIGIDWPLAPINLSSRDISYPQLDINFKGIKI